jgi:adenosylcobinamide kinase/adenosylcobinamide-phosphate guanylyltransferase
MNRSLEGVSFYMLILVTGGARSGKSTYAEGILHGIEGEKLYIATAIAFDDEMKDRILKHQLSRPDTWETVEGFKNLDGVLAEKGPKFKAVLLDCVTLWLTNLLFDFAGSVDMEDLNQKENHEIEEKILQEILRFADIARTIEATVVLVTNEIGMGIVPNNKLSRVFQDVQGRINQALGRVSDEVYFLVCGLPLKIKG